MKDVDHKKELLIDAIENTNHKYIEETRQAVSSDSAQKTPFTRRIKRLAHAPAVQFTAAACLVLLVLAGASKSGLLSDFMIPHSDSAETPQEISSGDSNQEAALQPVLTEPPELNLIAVTPDSSYDSQQEEQGSTRIQDRISAAQNEYQWTYNLTTEPKSTFNVCSKPWAASDSPVLTLEHGSAIEPDFNGTPPDSLSIRCLPGSQTPSQTTRLSYTEIDPKEDGSFILPDDEAAYFIKITAVWDNDIYSGSCTYSFRAEYIR